ncbi:MAG: preprotein translocase subunit SecE [Deltaproteobacteria bacterium]|nr:preprotein translocase subunit SecE [Deltaproteobacteria bacterium]MBW2143335.1 preprotein translocase subunit SecE [Deltaproteobacteria bacterium]
MKKTKQKPQKKKTPRGKNSTAKKNSAAESNVNPPEKKQVKQKPVRNIRKKAPAKKGGSDRAVLASIGKARQFLREAKMELKKVKWPTKKELLASTAVVIFLTLLMALYFAIVDFGLIKVIKAIIR